VQIGAAQALAKIKSPRALPALLAGIDRFDGFLLWEAMMAVKDSEDPRVVPTLIANVRKGIVSYSGTPGLSTLRRMKGRAVPEMVRQLGSNPDPEIRALMASSLVYMRDPRATDALLRALEDRELEVRVHAASTLGAFSGAEVVAGLMRVADHSSPRLRAAAVRSLGMLGEPAAFATVARALSDPETAVRSAALGLAGIDGQRAVPLLLPLFKEKTLGDDLVRAVRPLRDRRTVPALLDYLRAPGPYGFEDAAMALAEMDAREAIPVLIGLLREGTDHGFTVAAALSAFGRSAANPLLAFFPEAGDAQDCVVQALGGTGDPRAVDLLLPLIVDEDLGTSAIRSLGQLGDRRAIGPLIGRLKAGDQFEASAAAEALGALAHLGDRRAIGPLLERVRIGEVADIESATDALGEYKALEAVKPLLRKMEQPEYRARAAGALAKIGAPETLEPLLAYLAQNEIGRWMALQGMGSFRDPRVFRLLLLELENDEVNHEADSVAAATALGHYGDRAALPALRRAAVMPDNDDLAEAARIAIRRLTSR
ncbi:hypothetical protein EON81_10055, partial [bacterium]